MENAGRGGQVFSGYLKIKKQPAPQFKTLSDGLNPARSQDQENPMDYPALLAVLQQHANPERAVPMQAYMKHRFVYFGIGKPELARLCRPFFKDAAKQPVDWDFVRRCWDDPHRELQYAALEYLKKMQQHLTPQDIPRLQTLITEKSWWDSADVLDRIIGDIALRHPEVNTVLLAWSTDDNIWLRRVAIDHQLLRKQHTAPLLVLLAAALLCGKALQLLALGETVAGSLGLAVRRSRSLLLVLVALMSAVATLAVGPLSFIGLMTPHLARRSGAVSPEKQLPIAALYGAALMLIADWLGRYLIFPYELGAGVIASLLGGGFFLLLLRQARPIN